MKNLDGVPMSPAARAFRSPVGHPCSAKCCFRDSLSDISDQKVLQVRAFPYTIYSQSRRSYFVSTKLLSSCRDGRRDKIEKSCKISSDTSNEKNSETQLLQSVCPMFRVVRIEFEILKIKKVHVYFKISSEGISKTRKPY